MSSPEDPRTTTPAEKPSGHSCLLVGFLLALAGALGLLLLKFLVW